MHGRYQLVALRQAAEAVEVADFTPATHRRRFGTCTPQAALQEPQTVSHVYSCVGGLEPLLDILARSLSQAAQGSTGGSCTASIASSAPRGPDRMLNKLHRLHQVDSPRATFYGNVLLSLGDLPVRDESVHSCHGSQRVPLT